MNDRWLNFTRARLSGDQMGRPGLWRDLGNSSVFEVPVAAVRDEAPVEAWADATAAGAIPSGWTPPSADDAAKWLPAGGLIARSGALTAQGERIHEPERLALVFPRLVKVDAELPAARRRWLCDVLRDAQEKWCMVRLGLDAEETAVQAEVDLTGVPADCAEPLVRAAGAALVWVVGWVLPSLELIADPGVACRALEPFDAKQTERERKKQHV